MTCDSNDNSINIGASPPVQIPGFGSITSPVQLPNSEIQLPTQMVEDIVELVNKLKMELPISTLKPNAELPLKTVFDYISNLFTQLAPFLSFLNFAQAAFNMVVCIIEVLCALPNPIAIASKLKKLFTECLPSFLKLFPILALPVMIISLLLLILALIEYLITTIVTIIDDIVKNLQIISDAITLNDAESQFAAIQKIASLLCIIQNLFAILTALAAIMSVIETLAKLAGRKICADDDKEGCCPPELCPEFIKTTPDGIEVKNGKLIYLSQIGVDVKNALSLPAEIAALISIPPIRKERWQIYDNLDSSVFPISIIITPVQKNIFWPDPMEFNSNISIKKAPYTVDLKVTLDPKNFGLQDVKGKREFLIKDCIVVRKPHIGTYEFDNGILPFPSTGTMDIEGGLVFESDGSEYLINGFQATLNTFLHLPSTETTTIPVSDDSLVFDAEFIWKPNAGALAGYQLTTVGCMPEINLEKAVQNSIIVSQGVGAIIDNLPPVPSGDSVPSTGTFIPNITGTINCLNNAISDFRKNVSIGNSAIFQATISTCLNDLKNQTTSTLCATLISAVSIYQSSIELIPDIEFISRSIQVKVILNDSSGKNLAINIPLSCANEMANKLSGNATIGKISKFSYDGTSTFIAEISSDKGGEGILTIEFDGKILSTISIGVVGGDSSKINELSVNYQFVSASTEPQVRRDDTDVK